MADKEILLSIQHLEQFFKKGTRQIKAVNDLSVDVPKGELFALVGDKGCGKTTLGKSITRKLNATGGSVYFCGLRICAGVRRYYEGIDLAKIKLKTDVAELKKRSSEEKAAATNPAETAKANSKYKVMLDRKRKACKAECQRLTNEIIRAEYDHDHVDKELAKREQRAVDAKYADSVAQAAKRQLSIQLAEISAAKDVEKRKAMTEEQKEVIDVKYSVLLSKKEAELKAVAAKRTTGDKEQAQLLKKYKRERQLAAKAKVNKKICMISAKAVAAKKAIGAQTELVIVDTPAKIDAAVEQQALSALVELVGNGLTVIYLTRNLSAVENCADTVAIMSNGSVVELRRPKEVVPQPEEEEVVEEQPAPKKKTAAKKSTTTKKSTSAKKSTSKTTAAKKSSATKTTSTKKSTTKSTTKKATASKKSTAKRANVDDVELF